MAIAEKHSFSGTIAKIEHPVRGESLWMDSWKRLRRNKAALLGAVIILINILVAVFADSLAPKPYDLQVLADNKGNQKATRLTVTLKDGRCLVQEMDDFPGMPSRPLSREALRQKFLMLTAEALPSAERVFEQFDALESVANVREITPSS